MLFLTKYGRTELAFCGAVWTALGLAALKVCPPAAVVPVIGLAFTAYFFRDPRRVVPEGERNVVSPADGRVTDVTEVRLADFGEVPMLRIGIFLSVLDVHVNRAPCAGEVRRIAYTPGKFHTAFAPDAGEVNEANAIRLATSAGDVLVRQIAGLIARRIVCDLGEGQKVERGQKIGMIKFGSRTELYLPKDRVADVCVTVGQKVRGASSIVARFKEVA